MTDESVNTQLLVAESPLKWLQHKSSEWISQHMAVSGRDSPSKIEATATQEQQMNQ